VAEPHPDDHGRVTIDNVHHLGRATRVDAAMPRAMCDAMLAVLPLDPPGLTETPYSIAVLVHLPVTLSPGGAKAGSWAKAVQLDLEAKDVIAREPASPQRWHRAVDTRARHRRRPAALRHGSEPPSSYASRIFVTSSFRIWSIASIARAAPAGSGPPR
jgi:hypothetical protein